MLDEVEEDRLVRNAVFAFLGEQLHVHGELLPGFLWRNTRVPLIGPQGTFKPAVLPEMPVSLATAPEKPGTPRP